jgi:hypothetical protein
MLAAIQSSQLIPALFIQAQFNTGTVYIWTGIGSLSWNGHTWVGVGTLASISAIEEGADINARGISISLSGIDPSTLADALQEFQVEAPVAVYLGLFNGAGALLDAPILSWAGRMDQPTIDVGAETATISINAESRLLLMKVPCDRRYTAADQSIDFPGDNGLNFVLGIQNQNLFWGRVPSAK